MINGTTVKSLFPARATFTADFWFLPGFRSLQWLRSTKPFRTSSKNSRTSSKNPTARIGARRRLVFLILLLYHLSAYLGGGYFGPFFTFLHVVSGITWIGLLYYFNLVQIPIVPTLPAELKPAIGKYIAPEALFWFRWSALATVVTGLIVFSTQHRRP